ncbi:unnamed protein product (macronuclear) [Paramecium tetraurelia]|uniref:THUMP domain-containing protein n=1 Tax=Paramecium tetraurelia TaxID=5888 RepID=A0DIE7_PARTE|nr:uncharacterized protein GSPATT00017186001 [Paramecium tetraurelia]CAK82814.1 unnamed protein product [Paramecium tetraurelia]|eukprot:XP_001450211.1 hypothetical protein (macronuclear) [Paramecium tetraurelia strain d4-2]
MQQQKNKKKKFQKHQRSGQQQAQSDFLYSGFLITCDKNREREAVKEGYQIIEQYVEQIYPQESQKHEKLLEQNTNTKGVVKMLYNFDTKVKCVIFIRINTQEFPTIDVDELSRIILSDVYDKSQQVARYIYRMIPIQYVFRATLEEFKKHAEFLVNKHFQLDRPHPWFLIFKTRYTDKINKQQVLSILQGLIEPLHYQDWQEPEFVFFVEVNGAIMYINILPKYHVFREYSIRKGGQPVLDTDIPERKNNFVDKVVKKVRCQNEQEVKNAISIQDPNSDFQKKEFFEEQDVDLL